MAQPDDDAAMEKQHPLGGEAARPPEHSLPSYGEPTPETHRPISREEEAELALRSTTFAPGVRGMIIALFLLTVTSLLVLEPLAARSRKSGGWSWPALHTIHGLWGTLPRSEELKAAEKEIERESVLTHSLLPGTQLWLSSLLGAGNEQVYTGRGPWLFYRQDVEYLTGARFQMEPSLRTILTMRDDLKARGIELLLVPVPVKPSLEGEFLVRGAGPLQKAEFAVWCGRLRAAGVQVFDPWPGLAAAKRPDERLYLKSDTHWRPEVMERVARECVAMIRAEGLLPPSNLAPMKYRFAALEEAHLGDIAAMLRLPEGQHDYEAERVLTHPVETAGGEPWRPTRDAEVLLLGDSFANIYSLGRMGWGEHAGFGEHLSARLEQPLDCLLRNGDGASATREMLGRELARGSDRLAGKKLVIWEFAARELAFGNWQPISLAVRTGVPPPKMLALEPGRKVEISGTVEAISTIPRPNSVPYADHVATVHLVDLEGGAEVRGAQALVCVWSMRGNMWTAAAQWRPGDRVTVRARPWGDVASEMEKFNRSELSDAPELLLEEPLWGDLGK